MDRSVSDGFTYLIQPILRRRDNIQIFIRAQIFRPGLQCNFHELLLVHRIPSDSDQAFALEQVGNSARSGEVAVVLTEDTSDIRRGTVFVISGGFHYNRGTARSITFVDQLFEDPSS